MLHIDRHHKTLTLLEQRRLPEVGLKERTDLQAMIRHSADAFFAEIGEPLLLIGEEVRPTDVVEDRIDLLAMDQQGTAVVIELKRGNHKLHLFQALAYAGMIAKWDGHQLIHERSRFTGRAVDDVEEEIEQFLLEDTANLNHAQRILLVAEDFDYEVLVTAEWLSEQYDVDIRCYRLVLSANGETEFLTCSCIYPPPELTQHAIRRGARRGEPAPVTWPDWETALNAIENTAVADFFRQERAAGQQSDLGSRRVLRYRLADRRRLVVIARKRAAYVWQTGRFQDDVAWWTAKLGAGSQVEPVKGGQCLRFFLSSKADFAAFTVALKTGLPQMEFGEADEDGEAADA